MKEQPLKIFKTADFSVLQKPSIIFIIFCICFSAISMDIWRMWHLHEKDNNQFKWDTAGYYSYLPAIFCNNGSFVFYNATDQMMVDAPLGGKISKGTYGMALMYSPFFAIAYKISMNTNASRDGWGGHFSTVLHWGSIFYGLLGLLFLRNFLVKFYSEKVTTLTLAVLFLGTNLFYYVMGDSEMTHGYLFMLMSAFLLATHKWYEKVTYGRSILLGALMGIITLIRPSEILIGLLFAFWMVNSFALAKERLFLFLKNYKHILLMVIVAFLIWLPQLLYWNYRCGHYFYFSYPGERFFWTDPQITNILFSYRKGWFIYTPLMLLAFIGFFFMKGELKPLRNWLLGIVLLNIYILSCWWDWWFGGSFGARGFIQHYSYLSIPIASLFAFVMEDMRTISIKPLIQSTLLGITFFGISLNLVQSYQYVNFQLHFNSMTKKAYWLTFCKFHFSDKEKFEYYNALKEPDYAKTISGENRN